MDTGLTVNNAEQLPSKDTIPYEEQKPEKDHTTINDDKDDADEIDVAESGDDLDDNDDDDIDKMLDELQGFQEVNIINNSYDIMSHSINWFVWCDTKNVHDSKSSFNL